VCIAEGATTHQVGRPEMPTPGLSTARLLLAFETLLEVRVIVEVARVARIAAHWPHYV